MRVITSWLANEKRPESLPGNIKLNWELISSIVFCKTDSLRACVHVWHWELRISYPCLALIVYKLVSMFDIESWGYRARVWHWLFTSLCPCLTLRAEEIVPVFGIDSLRACVHVWHWELRRSCPCLALVVYKLVSVLKMIADKIISVFGINILRASVCVDIDSWRGCVHVWHR